MSLKTVITGAVASAAFCLAGVAHAAFEVTEVTLDPSNSNNGAGTIYAPASPFDAIGAAGFLQSTLTIGAATGNTTFTETGTFLITAFTYNATECPPIGICNSSGVSVNYNIYAEIDFSGLGSWNANVFSATSGTFDLTLYASGGSLGAASPLELGTANLVFGPDASATVTLVDADNANTSINGTFLFTPAAGTTGADGFFVAPDPFYIGFAVGNFGGNAFNTTYTIDGMTGEVVVLTPGVGLNPATGNLTFVAEVPEPDSLAMAGLGLVVLAGSLVLGRRRMS